MVPASAGTARSILGPPGPVRVSVHDMSSVLNSVSVVRSFVHTLGGRKNGITIPLGVLCYGFSIFPTSKDMM